MKKINEQHWPYIKLALALALLAFALLLGSSCQGIGPVPRDLPPGLKSWAAEKAVRLAQCTAAGKRGGELLVCLGEYATDRGTWACERARRATDGP